MIKFSWDIKLKQTETSLFDGHTYRIESINIGEEYRIDLLEDEKSVFVENTGNQTFKNLVSPNLPLEETILEWAIYIIKHYYGICDSCRQKKLLWVLESYDTEQEEFNGLERICKNCRDQIYSRKAEIFHEEQKEEEKKLRAYLGSKSFSIVGDFKSRIDAYRYLKNLKQPNVEELDGEFVYAKAILTANDGTFYPVFCVIDRSSGGELWDSQFIADGIDERIPQNIAMDYIGKNYEQIFPYNYETLAVIEEDFHQQSWFGTITQRDIRHHLTNLIMIKRPAEFIDIEQTEQVIVRSYFSIQHLLSLAFFTCKAHYIESIPTELRYDSMEIEHRTFCITGVMSAVSFLEAAINELFADSIENSGGLIRDIPNAIVKRLAELWKLGVPRTASYAVIQKYQIALSLAGKDTLDLGKYPAQDVDTLIKLRNALVHFEPEWVITQDSTGANTQAQRLEKRIKNKFNKNPLTGINNPFFPDKCLSYGCLFWALKSVIDFADIFFIEMGIIPAYERVRHKIWGLLESPISRHNRRKN